MTLHTVVVSDDSEPVDKTPAGAGSWRRCFRVRKQRLEGRFQRMGAEREPIANIRS